MKQRVSSLAFISATVLLLLVAGTQRLFAQTDTNTMTIFLTAEEIIHMPTDSGQLNKFLGNAMFRQGTDTLYCDSLYQHLFSKTIEAFGNVRLAQAAGTEGTCRYLRYVAAEKQAYMRDNVALTDGKNRLTCSELNYNLGTKMAVFNNNGDLRADSTHVTSNRGQYNMTSKEARFTGNVVITDPEYKTTSADMGYNTESKLTHFYAASKVVADSGNTILNASSGYYDSKKGLAYLDAHATLWYYTQYLEGDTIYFDKATGFGYANGHVIAWDATQLSALYCGKATYNRRKRTLFATIKPVLMQIKDLDTFYIRADTFYSAPDLNARRDTTLRAKPTASTQPAATPKKRTAKQKDKTLPPPTIAATPDTSWADTTAPLYFTGYHHVKIFSDSLQAVCDSVVYTQADSTVRLIYNPVAWSRNSQITGDTICLQLDSNKIKTIYVPNNAFIASLSGPDSSGLYDQVQGKRLKALFVNNAITDMTVYPDAEAIYYPKDESGAYIGVNQARSERIRVFFKEQGIQRIKLEPEVHLTLTPLEKADLPNSRLSRFRWLPARRPKDKYELFR